MQVNGPGGVNGPGRIDLHGIQPQQPAELSANGQVGDRAEISDVARLLNKLSEVPDVRSDRVQELRDMISSGKYETPDRVAGAVERILEEL